MNVSYSSRGQTVPEQQVRKALAIYKMALVNAHYRNWWHQVKLWFGDKTAIEAEQTLQVVEKKTKAIVNQSADYQAVCRVVSSQQQEHVRDMDSFLALIH